MPIRESIKNRPAVKKLVMWMISSENGMRPRWWMRTLVNPILFKRGKSTRIFSRARMDLMPYNPFRIGHDSTIEDYSIVNNGMGPVDIGNHVFIGAFNVIIGPVTLHDHIMTAQHVVISGMNHGIANVAVPYRYQPCTVAPITIGEGCWIGANTVITAGVQVGEFAVIAAGSVVTRDVPAYCMAGGNPARILKRFNHETGRWDRAAADPA